MGKLTKEERENCKPGICTKCGQYDNYRNTAGQCIACHNAGYHQYKAALKTWREAEKEQGRQFWAALGIKPGDKVERYVTSMIGFGACRVVGTAKIGKVGAYVSAPHFQRGYLTRHGWRKVESVAD